MNISESLNLNASSFPSHLGINVNKTSLAGHLHCVYTDLKDQTDAKQPLIMPNESLGSVNIGSVMQQISFCGRKWFKVVNKQALTIW